MKQLNNFTSNLPHSEDTSAHYVGIPSSAFSIVAQRTTHAIQQLPTIEYLR
jgi:hypothetical protein